MTLNISHRVRLDRSGPHGDCVWCGKDTDIWAITPFRPDIGRLPLHLFCGAFMRDAFRAMQDGRAIDSADAPNLARFQQFLLESGK